MFQTNTFAGMILNTENYRKLAQLHFTKTSLSAKQGCVRLRSTESFAQKDSVCLGYEKEWIRRLTPTQVNMPPTQSETK